MGTSNNLKESNITLKLVDLACSQCEEKFTEQEIEDENFNLWFDTSNDVQLETLTKGYYFSIWIRSIEHQNCPQINQRKKWLEDNEEDE